jgi:hypothetical protein
MDRHWKAALLLAVASVLAVVLGLLFSSLVGVVAFLASLVAWFVVAVAWMKPRGYQEHDAQGRVERDSR